MQEKQEITSTFFSERKQGEQMTSKSQYFEQYAMFYSSMRNSSMHESAQRNQLYQELSRHNITVKTDHFQPFNLAIIGHSPNREFVKIRVSWGYYSLQVIVLNITGQSIFHCHRSSSGQNAKIYHIDEDAHYFSVKCIKIKSQSEQATVFLKIRAFKEYFILRLAFALGIGPSLYYNILGFDLIYSESCIQFAMQTCKKINIITGQSAQVLKKNLVILHLMNIVHFDLKPSNLMWSDSLKREVMIDFGLSQIIDGGPGRKYLFNFRGSPTYCSSQMTSLLIESRQGYIDIYYNDVYCLIQTIRLTLQFSKLLEQDKTCSLLQDQIIDNNAHYNAYESNTNSPKLWLQITQLKKYIYSKNFQEIDLILCNPDYKLLLMREEILDFVRYNSSAFYLKEFYQKYIPDSIKQSIQNGWIEDWAKSTYPKLMTLQQRQLENQSLFSQVYQSLNILSITKINDIDSFTKAELQSILLSDNVQDKIAYFYCFQIYISFVNNIHQVTIAEKLLCCQFFLKIFISKQNLPLSYRQQQLQQDVLLYYIICICKFIINYLINYDMKNSDSIIDISKILQMILYLTEHIFFFSLLQTKQILDLLNQIYAMKIWSQLQKFLIIVSVVNQNLWSTISLFSEKSISYERIKIWFEDKLDELGKECLQPDCRFILDKFSLQAKYSHNIVQDSRFKQLPSQLQMQFLLTQLPRQFIILKEQPVVKIGRFISEHFPSSQRNRLFGIYFYFFNWFTLAYGNIQQSETICEIFKKNLLSNKFFQKLIFVRICRLHLVRTIEQEYKEVMHLMNLINPYNAGYLVQILFRKQSNLLRMMRNQNGAKFILMRQQFVDRLQKIVEKFNFRRFKDKNFHISPRYNGEFIFYYFILKSRIYFLSKQPGSPFVQEVKELQTIIEQVSCQKCYSYLKYQLFKIKLQEILLMMPPNRQQLLMQTLNEYLQFSSKNTSFDKTYTHHQIYSSVISKLMYARCDQQKLMKVIHQFYYYSKSNNQIENYMDNISLPNFISLTLMAILQTESMTEMIQYIKITVQYLRYTENTMNIANMINNYRCFLSNPIFPNYPELIQFILEGANQSMKNQAYVAAFFYSYIKTISQIQEIIFYMKKICLLIRFMPARIMFYFQVLIYFYITFERKQLWISVDNGNLASKIRKNIKMPNRLTKLLYFNSKDHYRLLKKQIKPSKNKCKKIRILENKCRKLGRYKFLDHPLCTIELRVNDR